MESNLKLDRANLIDESIKYRNLIGEFLYISAGTRPDKAFSVNYSSHCQSCYDQTHYKYAMRILKYLYKNFTKNSKHIDVQYHFVNENYENGTIDVGKINSNLNLADMLTKGLDKTKFLINRKALRLI